MIRKIVPWPAAVSIAAAFSALSCIERSNPFDPANSGPARVLPVREQLQPGLEARAAGEREYGLKLTQYEKGFETDFSANAKIMAENESRKASNLDIDSANAAVAAANATASVASLKPKQTFYALFPLKNYGYSDLEGSQRDLRAQTANLALFMSQANAANSPAIIYPVDFSDSVLAPFVLDSAAFAGLRARIDRGNGEVDKYNSECQVYNSIQADSNGRIGKYNDSINFLKSIGSHPVIARADSLDAGTKNAQAGDTLFIGEGTFALDLRFNNSGTTDKPILLRGVPGRRTIIKAPSATQTVMALSAAKYIHFQDVVFRGGRGVQLVSNCENIEFRGCVFDSSSSYGIRVTESGVDLFDCRLTENAQGAFIQGKTDGTAPVNLKNVLIVRNVGTGLSLISPTGGVYNSTLSDNGGEGIDLSVPHFTFNIFNTIISGNTGVGVYRHRDTEYQEKFDVWQSDVWGNKTIDWSLAGLDTSLAETLRGRNFSIEPEFNDPAALDYGPKPGSKFFEWEYQSPPLKIGYRP